MTKPLPTGCIKHNKEIFWETFNFLLQSVSFDDKIGYLYIVDIEFDVKNATEREYAYNEIYPPIIEKQKQLILVKDPFFNYLNDLLRIKKAHRLVDLLLKLMQIFFTFFLPMYLEDLVFCIKRAGWRVTKIHSPLTLNRQDLNRTLF